MMQDAWIRRLMLSVAVLAASGCALGAQAATITTSYPNSPLPGFTYNGGTVYSLPSQTLSASSYSINLGDSVTLTWSDTAGQDNIAPKTSHGYYVTSYIAACSSTGFSMPGTTYGICQDLECVGGGTSVALKDQAPFAAAAYLALPVGGTCTWQCYFSQPDFVPNNSGSVTVTPTTTTTYTYSCTNPNGTTVQSATVNVITPAPTATIAASPSSVVRGNSSGLSFSCTNSTSATIDNGVGSVAASGGTVSVSPTTTTTYTLTCTGAGGTTTGSAKVTVTAPAPTVTFSVSPGSINAGNTAVISWSSTDATSCTGSTGLSTGGNTSGSVTVSPGSDTTYAITCTGPSGTASDSKTLTVIAALAASCSGSPGSALPGQGVIWASSVSGGNGVYTYSWSGTDNLVGLSSTASKVYTDIGSKTASLTVTSGSQSKTVSCTNAVTISAVSATCSPSVDTQSVGQNVTWTVTPSGGTGSYTYSWEGSDGLSGSGSSVTIPYQTAGTKISTVTVTSQ